MESNHEKIQNHVKKYNKIYTWYWSAHIAVFILAVTLDSPLFLIGIAILGIVHIMTKGVDHAELDTLTNDELFSPESLKDRHP